LSVLLAMHRCISRRNDAARVYAYVSNEMPKSQFMHTNHAVMQL